MKEQWKEIEGSNGRYFVSDKGQVKSIISEKERMLKPRYNRRGLARVTLSIDKAEGGYVYRTVTVRRLVALAFVEGQREGYLAIHKRDRGFLTEGKQLDNSADSLEWVSRSELAKRSAIG